MSLEDLSFVVTEDQLNMNRTVDGASWLPLLCQDIKRELSNSAGRDGNKSWNTWFHFEVTDGDYKGMKLRYNVNEKMEGKGYDMFAAFLGRPLKAGEQIQIAPMVGMKVMGFVEKQPNKEDPTRFFNTITKWKPIS